MLEYYSQHPLLAFLVISLALIAIAVLIKAIKVSSARSKKVNDLMDKMKEDNVIKNKASETIRVAVVSKFPLWNSTITIS